MYVCMYGFAWPFLTVVRSDERERASERASERERERERERDREREREHRPAGFAQALPGFAWPFLTVVRSGGI